VSALASAAAASALPRQSSAKELNTLLQEAMEYGINFFDTSDITARVIVKGLGKSLHRNRDKVIIETKAGNCFSQLRSLPPI